MNSSSSQAFGEVALAAAVLERDIAGTLSGLEHAGGAICPALLVMMAEAGPPMTDLFSEVSAGSVIAAARHLQPPEFSLLLERLVAHKVEGYAAGVAIVGTVRGVLPSAGPLQGLQQQEDAFAEEALREWIVRSVPDVDHWEFCLECALRARFPGREGEVVDRIVGNVGSIDLLQELAIWCAETGIAAEGLFDTTVDHRPGVLPEVLQSAVSPLPDLVEARASADRDCLVDLVVYACRVGRPVSVAPDAVLAQLDEADWRVPAVIEYFLGAGVDPAPWMDIARRTYAAGSHPSGCLVRAVAAGDRVHGSLVRSVLAAAEAEADEGGLAALQDDLAGAYLLTESRSSLGSSEAPWAKVGQSLTDLIRAGARA